MKWTVIPHNIYAATERTFNIIFVPSGFKDCISAFCLTVKITCEIS